MFHSKFTFVRSVGNLLLPSLTQQYYGLHPQLALPHIAIWPNFNGEIRPNLNLHPCHTFRRPLKVEVARSAKSCTLTLEKNAFNGMLSCCLALPLYVAFTFFHFEINTLPSYSM